jgi:soluble lytic murein transglycosylase-like protein
MATILALKIPSINKSYYNSVSAKANENKIMSVIRPKYGRIIDYISSISHVPSELIESVIFIESDGNPNAKTKFATGLMQLSPATASDTIIKEKGLGRLDAPEAVILKKYLGSRYSLVDKVKHGQTSIGKTFVTNADLLKPEFNIIVGTILLKQLMDEFVENGKIRLDKVITIYNGGRYGSVAKKVMAFKGTTEQMLPILPKETSNYVVKLLGINGILDNLV